MNGEFGPIAARVMPEATEAFLACMSEGAVDDAVRRDLEVAQEIGAPGTPTLIINGVMHVSLVDSLALASMVEEARGS